MNTKIEKYDINVLEMPAVKAMIFIDSHY